MSLALARHLSSKHYTGSRELDLEPDKYHRRQKNSMTQHRQDRELKSDLVLRAISLLRELSSAVNEWQRTQVNEGFTVNQALMLHHLVSHGDATPSDLADWMHITRGSVTPTIKRLEDLGLVKRRIDENDGRKQWLTATQEARNIASKVEEQTLHPVLSALKDWSEPNLRQFCDNLQMILSSSFLRDKP